MQQTVSTHGRYRWPPWVLTIYGIGVCPILALRYPAITMQLLLLNSFYTFCSVLQTVLVSSFFPSSGSYTSRIVNYPLAVLKSTTSILSFILYFWCIFLHLLFIRITTPVFARVFCGTVLYMSMCSSISIKPLSIFLVSVNTINHLILSLTMLVTIRSVLFSEADCEISSNLVLPPSKVTSLRLAGFFIDLLWSKSVVFCSTGISLVGCDSRKNIYLNQL